MAKKQDKFYIPGIYHRISIRIVSQKWLSKKFGKKGDIILGYYLHDDAVIYLAKELSPEVKLHTFYHEVSHHIRFTLESIKDEEDLCDLQAAYLIKLAGISQFIADKVKE